MTRGSRATRTSTRLAREGATVVPAFAESHGHSESCAHMFMYSLFRMRSGAFQWINGHVSQ